MVAELMVSDPLWSRPMGNARPGSNQRRRVVDKDSQASAVPDGTRIKPAAYPGLTPWANECRRSARLSCRPTKHLDKLMHGFSTALAEIPDLYGVFTNFSPLARISSTSSGEAASA